MDGLISEIKKRNVLWNRRNPRYKDKLTVDNEWNSVSKRTGFTKEEAKKKWKNLRDQFAKELKKIPNLKPGENVKTYPGKWQYFWALMFLKDTLSPRTPQSCLQDAGFYETADHNTSAEEFDMGSRNSDNTSDEEFEIQTTIKTEPTSTAGTSSDSMVPSVSTTMVVPGTSTEPDFNNLDTYHLLQTNAESSSETSTSSHRKRKSQIDANEISESQLLEMESKRLAFLDDTEEDDDLMFFKSILPYFKQMDPIQKLRLRSKFQNIIIEEMTNPLLTDG